MTKPTDAEMIAWLDKHVEVSKEFRPEMTTGNAMLEAIRDRIASLTPTNAQETGETCADKSANAQETPFEPDYPNLVWEMYATTPEGEKVYCGSCDYARGANLLMDAMRERGFTDLSKNQVMRGNHGYSTLRRVQ